MKSKSDGWKIAREKAVIWHRAQKELRILKAKEAAKTTLDGIEMTDQILDLALAMLYLGEGAKQDITSISSSNPSILRFVLTVLKKNYGISLEKIRCDLHLRADQDPLKLKQYWSKELCIPIERFKYVAFDKRTAGKPTYNHYKGVCLITYGDIAIQRKLVYLYSLFMQKVDLLDTGM